MYYKIVSGSEIVDVCIDIRFVRWQKRISAFLACDSADSATGFVASDGSTIYLLDGAEQVNDLSYATYTEIDEETYNTLYAELVANGVLSDTETGASTSEESDSTTTETVAKSSTLQLIESLQAQVDMLTECLLEMSETVYG